MKKIGLLVVCALGAAFCAQADETTVNLVVNTNDDTQKKYDIKDIDFIDFDGDTMKIHLADAVEDIDIDSIEDMVFDWLSGIEEIRDYNLPDNLNVSINRGILTATQPGKTITVRVFDMNGHSIDMVSADSEISYSLADLAKGAYIVMVNDKAVKFIR